MNDKLYVPSKLLVGYQKRNDTYENKLGFVTYYDQKNILRQETSWRNWCNKELGQNDYENTPTSGFVLNKDVKRSSEWFGDGHNMIRIYDPRGFEMEITTGNLMFVLMTRDCLKRGLQGDFVYGWSGTRIILLPTDCDEYKNSVEFTSLQAGKVGLKDMIPGASYKTKTQEDLIYLGKFEWNKFGYNRKRNESGYIVDVSKQFIFVDKNDKFVPLNGLTTLAIMNSEVPVSNYNDLIDKFNDSVYSSSIESLESIPNDLSDFEFKRTISSIYEWNDSVEHPNGFYIKNDDSYNEIIITQVREYVYSTNTYIFKDNYRIGISGRFKLNENKSFIKDYGYDSVSVRNNIYTIDELRAMEFVIPIITLKNGRKYNLIDYINNQTL